MGIGRKYEEGMAGEVITCVKRKKRQRRGMAVK